VSTQQQILAKTLSLAENSLQLQPVNDVSVGCVVAGQTAILFVNSGVKVTKQSVL